MGNTILEDTVEPVGFGINNLFCFCKTANLYLFCSIKVDWVRKVNNKVDVLHCGIIIVWLMSAACFYCVFCGKFLCLHWAMAACNRRRRNVRHTVWRRFAPYKFACTTQSRSHTFVDFCWVCFSEINWLVSARTYRRQLDVYDDVRQFCAAYLTIFRPGSIRCLHAAVGHNFQRVLLRWQILSVVRATVETAFVVLGVGVVRVEFL